MRPRALLVLLLLAAGAAAGDPLEPERKELGGLDDAAYARWIESLALVKAALAADPANPVALDRAVRLLEPFGLGPQLEERLSAALRLEAEASARRAAILAVAGHVLILKAQQNDVRGWIIVGGQAQPQERDEKVVLMFTAAVDMLREAVRLRPGDARARRDLAMALWELDENANESEIERLHLEANAIEMRALERPSLPPLHFEAQRLRTEAEQLEQRIEPEPDHAAALLLRKQALVLEYCSGTIPFEYDASLYGPVSLLADGDLVHRNLTRTYRKLDGTIDTVPPVHYAPKPEHRAKIAEGLGRDPGPIAGAALLKVIIHSWQRDLVAEAAFGALITGRHEAVRQHMPALLAALVCVGQGEGDCTPAGQQMLLQAAVALDARAAAPVLAKLLPLDDDLRQPRGVARALAALGGPAEAEALLAVARDPARDVHFRREAILALGRLGPELLEGVPAEPYLELALAAARYRTAPSEALLGRLLQGIGHPHEVDDAARYAVELDVREAIPELERFLREKKDHYAAPLVKDAYDRLVARAKG